MSRQYYWKGSLATTPSYGATSGSAYTNWINSGSLEVLSNWVSYVEYSNGAVVGATQLPGLADSVTIRDVYPKIGTNPSNFSYQAYWLGTHSPCLNTTGKTLKVNKVIVGPFSSASNIPNNKWSEQNWVVGITSFAYPNFSASHGAFLGGSAGSTWNYGCPRVGGYVIGNTDGSAIQIAPLGITANTYPLGISSENIDIITENYNIWGSAYYGNYDIKLNRSPFAINIRTAVVIGATLYGGSNAVDGKCALTIKTGVSGVGISFSSDSYMTHATNPWMENTSIKIANNSTLTTIKHLSGYVNELQIGDEVQFYQYYTGQQQYTQNSEAGGGNTYASAAVQLLSQVGNFITEYGIPSLWIAPKIYSNEYISQYFIQKSVVRNWLDFASPQDTSGFTFEQNNLPIAAVTGNGSRWDISDTQMWPGVWNKTAFNSFDAQGYTAPPIPNYSVILGKQSNGGGTQETFKFSSHKYSPHSTTSLSLLTPSTYGWPSSFPSIFLRGSVYIPDFCLDSGQLRVDPTNSIGSYGVNCGNGRITSVQPYPFVSRVRSNITEVIPTQYGGWNVHSPANNTTYGLNIDSEWSGQIFAKDTTIRSHISPYISSSQGGLSDLGKGEQGSNIPITYNCPATMEYVERVTPYEMIVDKDDDGYIGDVDIYLSIWGDSVRDNFMGIYKPDRFLNNPTLLSADEELRKIELNILKTKRNKFVHGSNYNENACVNMVAKIGNVPDTISLVPCISCITDANTVSELVSWGQSNLGMQGYTNGEVSSSTINEQVFRTVMDKYSASGPQPSCDGIFAALYPTTLRIITIPVFPYFFIVKECVGGQIYIYGGPGGGMTVPPPRTPPCYTLGERPATYPPPHQHPPITSPPSNGRRDGSHQTPVTPPPVNPGPVVPVVPPTLPPCPVSPPVETPPHVPGGGRRSASLEYDTNDPNLPESPTHFSPLPPRYQPFA